MTKNIKICLPIYKLIYALMFFVVLSLVRGISMTVEIGRAIDTNTALLAAVFCAETYCMERSEKRWEVFTLYSGRQKVKTILQRLLIQVIFLCLLSYIGYFFFYWQKPTAAEIPFGSLYGMYIIAVTSTVLFWSALSVTLSNICQNQWLGIGACVVIWLSANSKAGEKVFGNFNIFAYSLSGQNWSAPGCKWLYGKAVGIVLSAVMAALLPYILKKRG